MKRKKKTTKKKCETREELEKDIYDLIDNLAYQDEKKNIQKSKSFLDSMYLLDQ